MKMASLACYLGVYINTLSITIIYPFGSLLAQEFGMAEDRSSTGYWVGLLSFSFMVGRLISSPIWGLICDSYGRRPVYRMSCLTVILVSISLGFTLNYWCTVALRGILGAFCCLILVGRIIVSELTSADPSAMAWTVIAGQLGDISGNILGGIFVNRFQSSELLRSYPFLMPNLLVVFISLLVLVFSCFVLPETLGNMKGIGAGRSYREMLKDRKIAWLCFLYFLFLINEAGFNELITLWCWADTKYGGFAFDPVEIGNILGISAIILVAIEAPFYRMLKKYIPIIPMARGIGLVAAITIFAMPFCSVLNRTVYLKYIVLGFSCICWWILNFMNVTNLNVIQNSYVVSRERGKMNALFIIASSTAKAIAPLSYGSIFAATAKGSYPFNYSFVFSLMALVSILFYVLSSKLKDIEYHKTEQNELELLEK